MAEPTEAEKAATEALKAANDKAAQLELQLGAAKKAQDDRDAAVAAAKKKADDDAAAALAKKGGDEAAKALAEANAKAATLQAQLDAINKAEEERVNAIFAKLPEDVRADIEPFRKGMAADDWGKLVAREANKANPGSIITTSTGDVGTTGRTNATGAKGLVLSDRAKEILDTYGDQRMGDWPKFTKEKILVTTEKDEESGAMVRKYGPGSAKALFAMMPKVQPRMAFLGVKSA